MASHDPNRPHDPDLVECSECGSQFDLARQHYYDNTCPDCIDDARRKRSCIICGDEALPENFQPAQLVDEFGRRERVMVCSDACTEQAEHDPRAPGPEEY